MTMRRRWFWNERVKVTRSGSEEASIYALTYVSGCDCYDFVVTAVRPALPASRGNG